MSLPAGRWRHGPSAGHRGTPRRGLTSTLTCPVSPFRSAVPWAVERFAFDADAFVHELVDSIIGDNYPVPDRMLVHNEQIVREYLSGRCAASRGPTGKFDLYAVEGGTAAMCYIFKSLKANRLLNAGDTIALARRSSRPISRCRISRITGSRSSTSRRGRSTGGSSRMTTSSSC